MPSLRQSPRKAAEAVSGAVAAAVTAARKASTLSKKSAPDAKKDAKDDDAKADASPKAKTRTRRPTSAKASPAPSLKRKASDDVVEIDKPDGAPATASAPAPVPTKKAKTKEKTDATERTDVAALPKAMYIGAHVSSAGGVQNAVPNAAQIGGNAFALFLKSQRKWQNPALDEGARAGFQAACAAHGYDAARHCLPHGSYLVNLAQPDADKAEQAYANFVDDLRRCAALGIGLYNFHPGAAVAGSGSRDAALGRIAAALNRAHRDTAPSTVVTVIENMAGGGTAVGDRFEDLAAIIAQVDDRARVGVCLDTCHAFAAGYDLRTPAAFAAVLAEFDRVVGLRFLRAVHLNDSKAPLASRRDLHANIGTGFLGLRAFHTLVNTDAFAGLPLVLETPITRPGAGGKDAEDPRVWADEIKLLESLIGMDADTDAFRDKAAALQAEGAAERRRIQEQVDKKAKKKK